MSVGLRTQDVYDRLDLEIDGLRDDFDRLSSTLHADPETAFEEVRASRLLGGYLSDAGFEVTSGAGGVATAFVATSGSMSSPRIALLVEYDALPDIGHACGHNLIAAGGAIMAVALRRALPPDNGTIHVIGTPAEEGGGGKVLLLDAGVFDGVDAAMMFHPDDRTMVWRPSISSVHLRVAFHGVAAHAAKNADGGRNALTAMIHFFVALDGLRQHIGEKARIHGVIRHGGTAPNVIPEYASADLLVRDISRARALALAERVADCANGAALGTGTRAAVEHTAPAYAERKNNHVLAERIADHLHLLGVTVEEPTRATPSGSSDIGNVSLVLPTVHPYIQITERGTAAHSAEFRDAAGTERARRAALLMSRAIARVAAEIMVDGVLLERARAEFASRGPDLFD